MDWLLHQWDWYRQNVEYTDLGNAVVWISLCHAIRYLAKVHPLFHQWRQESSESSHTEKLETSSIKDSEQYDVGQPVFNNALGRCLLWLGIVRD